MAMSGCTVREKQGRKGRSGAAKSIETGIPKRRFRDAAKKQRRQAVQDSKTREEQAGLAQAQTQALYERDAKIIVLLLCLIEQGTAPALLELERYVLEEIARERSRRDVEDYRKENTRFINAEKHILPYIGTGRENAAQRIFLQRTAGVNDRAMREGIALLRKEYPILNLQDGQGYYLSYDPRELMRYRNQEMSRIRSAFSALRGVDKALEDRR